MKNFKKFIRNKNFRLYNIVINPNIKHNFENSSTDSLVLGKEIKKADDYEEKILDLLKRGALDEAINLYSSLKSKNVLNQKTYISLMNFYSKYRKTNWMEALLEDYRQLFPLDIKIYSPLLTVFSQTKKIEKFEYYLKQIIDLNIKINTYTFILIFEYYKTHFELYKAENVFEKSSKTSFLVKWFIQEYLNRNQFDKAISFSKQYNFMDAQVLEMILNHFMLKEDHKKFKEYYNIVKERNDQEKVAFIKLFIRYGLISNDPSVGMFIYLLNFKFDEQTYSQLIYTYSLKNEYQKAKFWYEKAPMKEFTIINTMLKIAVENDDLDFAEKVFSEYQKQTTDIQMYSTMIRGYLTKNNYEKAQYYLFRLTIEKKMKVFIYLNLFNYYYKNETKDRCEKVLKQLSTLIKKND